jgi:hypothetical protein
MAMTTAAGMSGATVDALRMQIETELRAESRRRRLRIAMVAAAVLLLASLALNVIALTAPRAVGLAAGGEVDALRESVVAADRRAGEALALGQAATRRAAGAAGAAEPVAAMCTALADVAAWAYTSGEVPALECPTPPSPRS